MRRVQAAYITEMSGNGVDACYSIGNFKRVYYLVIVVFDELVPGAIQQNQIGIADLLPGVAVGFGFSVPAFHIIRGDPASGRGGGAVYNQVLEFHRGSLLYVVY
ncbi:hypothetical protein [Xanthocytophaga agilis]|uniref:hypothetical protein n=1 Tax=Xanthocytophaga agilis TaxID=3048010 RepID=UPI0030145CCE